MGLELAASGDGALSSCSRDAWLGLAAISLETGNYMAAKLYFERALQTSQAIHSLPTQQGDAEVLSSSAEGRDPDVLRTTGMGLPRTPRDETNVIPMQTVSKASLEYE